MARDFNGSTDRLDWAAINNLTGDPITISAWIYSDGWAGNQDYVLHIHNSTDTSTGIILSVASTTAIQLFRTGTTSLFRVGNFAAAGLGGDFTGEWHHILVTHTGTFNDATTIKLYIDGVDASAATSQNGATEGAATGSWSVGGRIYDDNRNFDGKIALVGVWSRALDAGEIAGLAAGNSPQFYPTDLVFYAINGAETKNYVTGTAASNTDGTSAYADPAINHPVIKSESITLSESIGKLLANYTASVHEDVTLTANINEGDIAVQEPEEGETLLVDLHDDVTVTEAQSYLSPTPKLVSQHEDITVTDSLPGYHADTIFVDELVSIQPPIETRFINVNEDITLSEDITVFLVNYCVSKTEDITITESASSFIANYNVQESESITITDSLPGYHKDTIFVFESITVGAPFIQLYVNVSDTVTLDETVDTALGDEEYFFFSVSDTITVIEPPFRLSEILVIEVHEDITVTESIIAFQVPLSEFYAEVNDNVSVTESITVSLLLADVAVHDHITITENVIASSYPDLSVSIDPETTYVIGVLVYP